MMKLQFLLLAALCGAALAQDGATCATVNPEDKDACCADKLAANIVDESCPQPIGGDCASRGPDALAECCLENPSDAACSDYKPDNNNGYKPRQPLIGSECGSLAPEFRAECCREKRAAYKRDPSCTGYGPRPRPDDDNDYKPYRPRPGAECASRGPQYKKRCCAEKRDEGIYDRSCKEERPRPKKTCASLKKRSYRSFRRCCESDYADFSCPCKYFDGREAVRCCVSKFEAGKKDKTCRRYVKKYGKRYGVKY